MQTYKVVMVTELATFTYLVKAANMLDAVTKVHRTDYISLDIREAR